MLGTIRFVLATLVVISHLAATPMTRYFGDYAVRAFFVMSGFAMTYALNKTYLFDGSRFLLSRSMRLVPGYCLACLVTAVALMWRPLEASEFLPSWTSDPNFMDVVQNVAIVPLIVKLTDFRLVEQAWSTGVEIVFYFLLYAGMARSHKIACTCLAFGIAFHAWSCLAEQPFSVRYFTIPGAMIDFSIGSLLYFWRERGSLMPNQRIASYAAAAWVVNLLVAGCIGTASYEEFAGYYCGILLSAILIGTLEKLPADCRWCKLDAALGHISYPLFLFQWVAGFLAHELFCPGPLRGWTLALFAFPLLMGVSAVVAIIQLRVVEPLREPLRKARQHRSAAIAALTTS